jgi:septum formation protein
LVLASASSVRAALLEAAGVRFDVAVANVDEDAVKETLLAEGVGSRGVANALAELKALRISSGRPETIVLGADQVLDVDGELLSKAATVDELRRQLIRLRGRVHRLVSACALAKDAVIVWRDVREAKLWMRDFSDAFLDDYLAREAEHVLWSVGGYRLEGVGVQLFERIEGDYFSILGLQVVAVLSALRELGLLAR